MDDDDDDDDEGSRNAEPMQLWMVSAATNDDAADHKVQRLQCFQHQQSDNDADPLAVEKSIASDSHSIMSTTADGGGGGGLGGGGGGGLGGDGYTSVFNHSIKRKKQQQQQQPPPESRSLKRPTIRRKRNRHQHLQHASAASTSAAATTIQETNAATLRNLKIRIVPLHVVVGSNDDDDDDHASTTTCSAATTCTRTRTATRQQQQHHQQQHLEAKTTTTTTTTITAPNKSLLFWLRLIDPYPYTFVSFAKARWVGRTILDVYATEFQSYPVTYYRYAIQTGRIQVIQQQQPRKQKQQQQQQQHQRNHNTNRNDNESTAMAKMTTVSCDYRIQAPDALCHTVHRHEPAVQVSYGVGSSSNSSSSSSSSSSPQQQQITSSQSMHHDDDDDDSCCCGGGIKIVGETAEVLAVDKPSTLPVHPCGGYHQNSLIPLLERARNHIRNDNDNSNSNSNDVVHNNSDNDNTTTTTTTTTTKKPSKQQQQQQRFYTIHRLDRLTSGLVILAKSSWVAQKWAKAIQERHGCMKLYLARVRGRFPVNIIQSSSSGGGEVPRLDGGQQQLFPVYGEWKEKNQKAITKKEKDAEKEVEWLRKRNAFGYWMTTLRESTTTTTTTTTSSSSSNSSGYDDGSVTKISLEDFANIQNKTQDWLNALSPERNCASSSDTSLTAKRFTWLHFACPVRIANIKDGVCESGTFDNLDMETYLRTVKPAQTSFASIAYDTATDTTVVLCRPGTGRTHQIRVHLQHLGHPIANDPNYTHDRDMWYADPLGRQVCKKAKAFLDAMDAANSNSAQDNIALQESLVTSDVPATETEIDRILELPHRTQNESLDEFIQRTCVWCARSGGQQEERNKKEFLVRSPGIWLHALQYQVKLDCSVEPVCFATDPPSWCNVERSGM